MENISCVISKMDLIAVTKPIIKVLRLCVERSLSCCEVCKPSKYSAVILKMSFQVSFVCGRSGCLNPFPIGLRQLSMSNKQSMTLINSTVAFECWNCSCFITLAKNSIPPATDERIV